MEIKEQSVSYAAPKVKEIVVSATSIICTSPGGDGNTDMGEGGDLED